MATTEKKEKTPAVVKPRRKRRKAGDLVAEARAEAKLTQVELAKKCKIGQNRMSAIELSDNLTFDTLEGVLNNCGFTLSKERLSS